MRSIYFTLCLMLLSAPLACDSFASARSRPTTPTPQPSSTYSPNPYPSPMPTNAGGADAYSGPYMTTESEYHLPASMDSDVLSGVNTEEWAAVYRPLNMGTTRHPVLVFLHGNHATCGKASDGTNLDIPVQEMGCQYTQTQACGAGEAVIPSHLGFGYLASRLASYGYVVVSINANLGITCGNPVAGDDGLVLARGRLVLKHLMLLSQWNRNINTTPSSLQTDFYGKLDFSQVGLLGHSRGGEGVRAAYNLYKSDPSVSWQSKIPDPVTFKGIFEIGPVDGQSNRVLNASGTAWNVLLPMCDGDVRHLEGMKPFDRMLSATNESPTLPKSMFAVWGANHNFYNSYWQSSDSPGCVGSTPLWSGTDSGSGDQQMTAIVPVVSFFRAHVGEQDASLATVFNPLYAMPSALTQITPVDRTFVVSNGANDVTRLETFQGPTGVGISGVAEDIQSVTAVHTTVPDHDSALKAAKITWSTSGSSVYYQNNWTNPGAGIDTSHAATLDFRVSRNVDPQLNTDNQTDFAIQLVRSDGSLGQAVHLSQYLSLVGPLGSAAPSGGSISYHATLPTVRIPMSALGSVASAQGVRLTFDTTGSGDIFISDIDLSNSSLGATKLGKVEPAAPMSIESMPLANTILASAASAYSALSELSRGPASATSHHMGDQIVRIEAVREPNFNDESGQYEVEVESSEGFQVRDALPVLRLNGRDVGVGSFSPTGDLHSMTFRVSASDLSTLPSEFEMEVGHREDPQGPVKAFGSISKYSFH